MILLLLFVLAVSAVEITHLSSRMIKFTPDDLQVDAIEFCTNSVCMNYTITQLSNGRLVFQFEDPMTFPKTYVNGTLYYAPNAKYVFY